MGASVISWVTCARHCSGISLSTEWGGGSFYVGRRVKVCITGQSWQHTVAFASEASQRPGLLMARARSEMMPVVGDGNEHSCLSIRNWGWGGAGKQLRILLLGALRKQS